LYVFGNKRIYIFPEEIAKGVIFCWIREVLMVPEAKILIVDDDPVILKLLTATLNKYEYSVSTAVNGRLGLEMVADDPPDLVLLDIQMPEVDGFATLEGIKSDPALARVPVVMLTSISSDRDTKIRCLELGADDFLTKPFDEQELLIRIRNHTRLKMLCEVEIEKERMAGALKMAQAASLDMKELLNQILETSELLVFDRKGDLPKEKYFEQFKQDINEFVDLTERLAGLEF
jgi:DNA-binding response OmpR family regulator